MTAGEHPATPATPAADGQDAPLTRASLRAMRAARHALQVPPVPRDFRSDIEGMRAIAVIGVMLWHAGVTLLPGGFVGVDVFFVVSGFLMTSLLLEEGRARGRIDVPRFYARRARRLLPAALSALLGTAVITVLAIPRTRWGDIGGDILASAAYVVNWRMSGQAVDYLDLSRAPSPVQHYWSLSVEEQFYLVWPLLILVVLAVARGRAKVFGVGVWTLTAVLLGGSLALSWWWTQTSPAQAYFVTPTRVYELMLGAVVALGARTWATIPRWMNAALGWLGLAMILSALLLIDKEMAFPGTLALLPTVGTALVIIAGFTAGGAGPDRLLRARPLQWVGRISYSLYLWHWPFVAAAASLAAVGLGGPESLPVHWGLLAVLISVVPAWLSFRYVEDPVRRHGRLLSRRVGPGMATRRTLLLGINCTLAGAIAGMILLSLAPPSTTATQAAWRIPAIVDELRAPVGAGTLAGGGDESSGEDGEESSSGDGDVAGATQAPGDDAGATGGPGGGAGPDGESSTTGPGTDEAAVTTAPPQPPEPEIPDKLGTLAVPLEQVPDDTPVTRPEGCHVGLAQSGVGVCEAGDPEGEVTVGLFGDSHAGMWLTALDEIGRERGWRVQTVTKASCPPTQDLELPADRAPESYDQCRAYQPKAWERLLQLEPDVVVLSSAAYSTSDAEMAAALGRRIDGLRQRGILPVVIRDVPRPGFNVPDCLVSNPDKASECAFEREDAQARAGTGQLELLTTRPGLPFLDLTEAICPGTVCSPVVGDVVVWRDSNHLSATYIRSLTDLVDRELAPWVRASHVPEPGLTGLIESARFVVGAED